MTRSLIALTFVAGLGLAGCQSAITGDLAGCAAALLAAGSTSPAELFRVAASTPACQGLAADVLQRLIPTVAAHQKSRGM